MVQHFPRNLITFVSQIGVDPADTAAERLQKTLLLAFTAVSIIAGFLWGALYLAFDEPLAAAIPLGYAVLSLISVALFQMLRHYVLFRFTQLLLILLLPFLLMIALGGFINGSAVIVWSFLCPMGALIFCGTREARFWLLVYLGLLVASGLMENLLRESNNLPPSFVTTFFVMNIGTISVITLLLLSYFIVRRDEAYDLLQIEQDKSERLLLNVLPQEIATILKSHEGILAEQFDSASVLFADLVGFTPLSMKMTPVETVELLNTIFSHFDSLVDKYDLEKIRTVGDNYMVAAGVPRPRPDHCESIARLALEMRDYLVKLPPCAGQKIEFRIGINTGPLVGGVIGQRKFHYDVWGDAVNTAARMESHGVPQEIQITSAAYSLLRHDFICEERGYIEVKGKGRMSVWLLTGEKQPHPDV